jgi:hypothetical protein
MTSTDLEKLPPDLRETILAGHEGAVGKYKLKYKKIHGNARKFIDARVMTALVRLQYTDEQIIGIFHEPAFGIGDRYRREASGEAYLDGLLKEARNRARFEELAEKGEESKFTYLKQIRESADKARAILPALAVVPDEVASVIVEGGSLFPYDDRTPRPIMDVRIARQLFRVGLTEEDIRQVFTSSSLGASEMYFRAALEGMGDVYLETLIKSAQAWTEFEVVWKKLYYDVLGETED